MGQAKQRKQTLKMLRQILEEDCDAFKKMLTRPELSEEGDGQNIWLGHEVIIKMLKSGSITISDVVMVGDDIISGYGTLVAMMVSKKTGIEFKTSSEKLNTAFNEAYAEQFKTTPLGKHQVFSDHKDPRNLPWFDMNADMMKEGGLLFTDAGTYILVNGGFIPR